MKRVLSVLFFSFLVTIGFGYSSAFAHGDHIDCSQVPDSGENGTVETAEFRCLEDQTLNGTFDPFLDADYYHFDVPEGEKYSLSISFELDQVDIDEFLTIPEADADWVAILQLLHRDESTDVDPQLVFSMDISGNDQMQSFSTEIASGEYFLRLRPRARYRGSYHMSLDFESQSPSPIVSEFPQQSIGDDVRALVLMVHPSEVPAADFFTVYAACARLLGKNHPTCTQYDHNFDYSSVYSSDSALDRSASAWFDRVSGGRVTIEADFFDWFQVSDMCQGSRIRDDFAPIVRALKNHPRFGTEDIHNTFNQLIVVFPPRTTEIDCLYGVNSSAYTKPRQVSDHSSPFRYAVFTPEQYIVKEVLEHELSHTFGGGHSQDCAEVCQKNAYADAALSALGKTSFFPSNSDLHNLLKLAYGWIDTHKRKIVHLRDLEENSSVTVRLDSFYNPLSDGFHLLEIEPLQTKRIRLEELSSTLQYPTEFFAELRPEGVLVYTANKSTLFVQQVHLPNGALFLQEGQMYSDAEHGIRILVDEHESDFASLTVSRLDSVDSLDQDAPSDGNDSSDPNETNEVPLQSEDSDSTPPEPSDQEPPVYSEQYPLPSICTESTCVTSGAQTITGPSYNVNTSHDLFAFTPSVRGSHVIYSEGSVAIDTAWLIDPEHNDSRLLDYDADQSAVGQNFRIGGALETDRTYYIYVEYQAGANGTYGIEIIEPVDNSDSYGLNDDHSNRLPGDLTDQPFSWFDSRDATNMTAGQTTTGVIETQLDVDVFRVTLPVEHMSTSYQVSISSDAPVTYIKESCGVILDDSQAPVYTGDGSYAHEFIYRAGITPLPEDFEFCVVMQGTAGANYTLEAGRVFPELGADDFGNTIQKSSLVTNGWVTGATQTDGDVDVFRYEPSTSGNVMVQLKTPDFSPGVSMTLLDASGNEIPNSFRQSDGIAVVPATTGQNVYVRVQGAVSGVTYHLTVGDEDYMNSSSSLPVNPVLVSDLGNVSGVYSIDADGRPTKFFYQFSVPETGDYELKINQPDEAKSFLTVYNEDYQTIAGRESYAGYDHAVYPYLEAGKTYVVSLWRGHSINLIDLPFDLDLVKLQTAITDESDRFDQPETLVAGQQVRGYFNHAHDVDVYSFVAPQDGHIQLIPRVPAGGDVTVYNRTTHQQTATKFGFQGELMTASGSLPVKAGEEIQVVSYAENSLGAEYGFQFVFSPGAPASVAYPAQLPTDSYWPLVNYGVPKLIDFATDYSVSYQGYGWFYVDQDKSFDVHLMNGGRFILLDDRKNYVTHGFAGLSQVDLEEGAYYLYLSRVAGETGDFDLRIEATNIEPTLSFETSSLDEVFVGTPVSFNLSNSVDPDGSIVSYDWTVNGEVHPDFTGDVVSYGFDTTGDYTVEITITDDRGAQVSESVSFTVEDRPDGDGSPALARELGPYPYGLYQMDYYFLSYYINNSVDQLEYVGDVDFFTFVPTRTGRASIFTNSSLSTLGKLYDENQNLIEVSEYKRMDDNFFISAVLEANKRYYVSVESEVGETGDYYLYVQKSADDHEPAFNMATPLEIGVSMEAKRTFNDDAFRFTPSETREYYIAAIGSGVVQYLFTENADDYYSQPFISAQGTGGQLGVVQTLNAGTTYYLGLRTSGGTHQVFVVPHKDDHQDLQVAATPLSENVSVSGQVDDTEDVDWFRVPWRYVYPGELYSVVYTGSSSAELVIGTNTVALTSGQARNINDSIGSYNTPVYVKVSGTVGSYSVEFIKESDDHGDNEAAATTMGLQVMNGKIGTPGDVDVFKYTQSGYYCKYVNVQILSGTNKTISRYNNRMAQTWMPTNTTYFYEYMCPGNYMYLRIQDAAGGIGDYSFRTF